MAKFHFFCELNKLQSQTAGSEFGPINANIYNLTSLHNWNSNPPEENKCWAYAIFDGIIRYQKDSKQSNSLNAILKPNKPQHFKNLPEVKYLIYRGIKEDSLLESTNKFKTGYSDQHIIYRKLGTTSPSNDGNPDDQINTNNYLELGLGIVDNSVAIAPEVHIADSEDLDRLFYNDSSYAAITVNAGDQLGLLHPNFGMDVILDGFWRKPTMKIVRDVDVSASGNQIKSPSNKGDKEQILQYMDIAAFIGCLYKEKIGTDQGNKKKDDIYNDILSKFVNKNRVYLDIRNENNLSLNFYDNYTDGLQLTDYQNGSQAKKDYITNDWPIVIFDTPNATDKFINTLPNERKTKIELALPINDNTLNLCFLKHAPTYREEFLEIIKRWPHYEKRDAKFVNLKNDGATFSQNIALSTYQTQTDEVVPFYFRLFYAKQNEEQTTGDIEIKANNPLDNLFTLQNYNTLVALLSRTDSSNSSKYRAVFDGNEKYIRASSDDASKKNTDILYSGMYKTGIALDSSNIYFFAVPYSLNENIKMPKVKLPIAEFNDSKGFLNVVASQSIKIADLGINKIEIVQSPANLFLLNLYSTPPQKDSLQAYDTDTILCVCMERAEFQSQIDSVIDTHISNPFQNNIHPIQLQVIRQDYEPKGTDVKNNSHTYHVMELRVVGYKSAVLAVDSLVLNFYGLPNQGRLVSTNNAATQVQVPILKNTTQITIGHDPYNSTIERNKYEEIVQALGLVKKYNPSLMQKVEGLIINGQKGKIPNFEYYNPKPPQVNGYDEIVRKYKLTISYDLLPAKTGASTNFTPQNILEKGTNIQQPSTIPIVGKTLVSQSPNVYAASGINYSEYESHAVATNKTPKQIARDYVPEFNVRYPEYYLAKTAELQEFTYIADKGIGLVDNESPSILINENIRDITNTSKFKDGQIPLIVSNIHGELYRFEDVSARVIRIAEFLAHELGHFVFGVQNQFLKIGWELLERHYKEYNNLTPNTDPKYGDASGHLEGNPTGNKAAIEGYEFSKKFVEGVLWPDAIEQIIKNGQPTNFEINLRNMKKVVLLPTYLQVNSLTEKFELYDHLWGNLLANEIEIPKE